MALGGCSNNVAADGEDGPDLPTDPTATCGNGSVDPDEFCHELRALELAPTAVMIADFDGDGRLDVGSRTHAGDSVEFLFWPGDGQGGFGAAQPSQTLEAAATRWRVASLDGDGAADLVAVDTVTGTISSFTNSGGGQFGPAVVSSPSTQGLPWSDVAVFDADTDGDDDLVVEPLERDADLFALDGDAGLFTDPASTFPADAACWGMAWAESPAFGPFGDGLVHLSGICNDGSPQQALTALLPSAESEVVVIQGAPEIGAPEEVVIGDFDGDGAVDMLVWDSSRQLFAAYSLTGQEIVLVGDHGLDALCTDCAITGPVARPSSHAGQFGGGPANDLFLRINGIAYFIFDPLTDAPRAFTVEGVSGGLEQGDFNGDGLDDFFVRNTADNDTHILLSRP